MMKPILLSLLVLPLIVACDKQQPATPAVPIESPLAAPTPTLQPDAPTSMPTPLAAAPTALPMPTKKVMPTAKVTSPAPAASASGGGDLVKGEAVYKASCSVCHAMGVAGAPKLNDKAGWQPRIAQGKAVLHQHAIKGFTGSKGVMPAKGGNSSLSDDDVMAAVDYMVSQAK